ncbi:SDR family NAD(P)-dependent oxidoreductase [Amycolatopsis sp. NBRC 101858]|uniref:SDR family NAD(P)-dependent oxidoreductase n=1 Tax=Amycolatopsis sp. NBRC 101858 TaxID=3032200 RepID=UPI00255478FC|nr:SDR family oxidoreductase [Amycolatopsis sp. NBRC 101858]
MPRQVVVTGGTTGIGRAIAARFAAAGDAVVITGRDAERTGKAAAAIGAAGVACDAADPAAVTAFAAGLEGQVDVLVNVAGGNLRGPSPDGPLADLADWWTRSLALNLLGTVLTTTAVLPRMPAGGAIIATGSAAAEFAPMPYSAAKAAVQSWISGLSSQVGPRGITANTIVPGYVADTEFYAGTPLPDGMVDGLVEATHTKRAGTPEDVAGLAVFLAGPDARHITGQVLHVNGGSFTTR